MKSLATTDTLPHFSEEYKTFLKELKNKIRAARYQAAIAVNQGLLQLYWYIGKQILEKQEKSAWGSKLIEMLSLDLRNSFPETSGFSIPNLKRMRLFAQNYPQLEFGSQAVSQLPWGHIAVLIHKIKNESEREWYSQQIIEQGWSRATLERYINQDLYRRQALASEKISNYLDRLPSSQSTLAQELFCRFSPIYFLAQL